MINDVKILFPGCEKKRRSQRGMLPNRIMVVPPIDKIIAAAFENLLLYKMTVSPNGRYYCHSSLLGSNKGISSQPYGYSCVMENISYPFIDQLHSYKYLQSFYDNVRRNTTWYTSLSTLIQECTHIDGSSCNSSFMKEVKEKFINKDYYTELANLSLFFPYDK